MYVLFVNSVHFELLELNYMLYVHGIYALSLFRPPTGETSGTVVPSTSDDKTAVYDPHDYDEVPLDEGATLSRSPLGVTLSAPPAVVESAVPGPAPADPIPEIEDDGVYSVVSQR